MERKVLVTGAGGLVGTALCRALKAVGQSPLRLVRGSVRQGEAAISWNPARQELEAASLEGLDAAVHLAGENVGEGRWSQAKKERLVASRVQGTGLLSRALAGLQRKPEALVCASAIGYYGADRGGEVLTEESAPGTGFLADLVQAWEKASEPARQAGIRVVLLRIAVVLDAKNGALARMLPAFRLGLGGPVGSGKQYFSWIALDDVARAIRFCLDTPSLSGPVNASAPLPVTNREFSRALGRALHRPAFLGVPELAARIAFGSEKAGELLLSSNRVEPARLLSAGFRFQHPEIEGALRKILAGR